MAPSKTESGVLAPYAQKPNGLLLRSDPLPTTKGQLTRLKCNKPFLYTAKIRFLNE